MLNLRRHGINLPGGGAVFSEHRGWIPGSNSRPHHDGEDRWRSIGPASTAIGATTPGRSIATAAAISASVGGRRSSALGVMGDAWMIICRGMTMTSHSDPAFALAAEVADAIGKLPYTAPLYFHGFDRHAWKRDAIESIRSGNPDRMRKALEELGRPTTNDREKWLRGRPDGLPTAPTDRIHREE